MTKERPRPDVDPYDDLEAMLKAMATRLVDQPDDLVVLPARGPDFIHFEVRCAPKDLGALIGRAGKHAEAMRMLLSAAATIHRVRVTMQCLSNEGGGHAGR
jgi:predicted RNA-binding protein YlqC (UPF0109 family)